MPHSPSARKKTPLQKALVQKEQELAWNPSSCQRAAPGRHVTSDKETHAPVTANPVLVTSLASTSPSASVMHMSTGVVHAPDQGMLMYYCHLQLTALTGNGAPAATISHVPQDSHVASELAVICGEYVFCVHFEK